MEGDLNTLINYVFNDQPKPVKSISIIDSFDNVKDLFEALLMMFTGGMNILYGDSQGKVNLKTLSEADYNKFTLYFSALGIKPKFLHFHLYQYLKIKNLPITNKTQINWDQNKDYFKNELNEKYFNKYSDLDTDQLTDMYFQLKCDEDVYVVFFEFIN